jgi:emfourin
MAEQPERIELERTGGFANIPLRASVPVSALSPDERAGIDALHAHQPADQPVAGAPDRYQYDLTIIAGEHRHHVRIGEPQVDDRLRALVDRMEREATPGSRRPE